MSYLPDGTHDALWLPNWHAFAGVQHHCQRSLAFNTIADDAMLYPNAPNSIVNALADL